MQRCPNFPISVSLNGIFLFPEGNQGVEPNPRDVDGVEKADGLDVRVAGFADAPGYRTIKTIQAEFLNQLTRPQLGLAASLSWGELIERGYIVAGSPETVRQRMEQLIKTLRVGNIICGIHVGNMPPEKTRHSTELFAKKVMPQLRGIWKDWDNDERFWIHPLPQRAVPAPIAAEAAR